MAKRKKYNKLVRDKIPEYIKSGGDEPIFHIADEKEYWQKLEDKLLEEVREFEKDENIEEFADILEVLDAISDYKKFNKDMVAKVKEKKAKEKGKFKNRIILDES